MYSDSPCLLCCTVCMSVLSYMQCFLLVVSASGNLCSCAVTVCAIVMPPVVPVYVLICVIGFGDTFVSVYVLVNVFCVCGTFFVYVECVSLFCVARPSS